jgi:TetR/AcrR family tetracycline transcriptional repressor
VASDHPELPVGMSRPRIVAAALELVQRDGIHALTMRSLAERLHIKAASLYWHVRDRDELLELLATALLAEVGPLGRRLGWRADALAVCAALERLAAHRRDAGRILLAVPDALDHSQAHATLSSILAEAGLAPAEAFETATMMLSAVLVRSLRSPDEPAAVAGRPLLVAIDTGSRGVTLRAGANMSELIDRVIVRRLRDRRQGELELNQGEQYAASTGMLENPGSPTRCCVRKQPAIGWTQSCRARDTSPPQNQEVSH